MGAIAATHLWGAVPQQWWGRGVYLVDWYEVGQDATARSCSLFFPLFLSENAVWKFVEQWKRVRERERWVACLGCLGS